jgi:hypothetical protein
MRSTRLALLGMMIGLLLGCSGKQGPATGPLSAAPNDLMQIAVHNETTSSLRIYAEYAGDEVQLGRVDALSERSLRVPYAAGGTLRLVARASAGAMDARHRSEPIQIVDGQRVEWHLRLSPGVSSVPRLSTVRVFACSEARC